MKKNLLFVILSVICLSINKGHAVTYILVSGATYDLKKLTHKSDLSFKYVCQTLGEAHNYILNNMCGPKDGEISEEIIIYIRQGTYKQDHILWKVTSPSHRLKIMPFQNEEVIFDGKADDGTLAHSFIELSNKNGPTNIWIEGLIIQNYANGIWLGNTIRDKNGKYFKGVQNSHNVIMNNEFRNIGNKFSTKFQEGYSALGLNNSNENIITGNTFCHNENDKLNEKDYATNSLMHSIYLAHYSKGNTIKDNYISNCSGDAIRIRNGCKNNTIDGNYILLSGTLGFVTEWYRTPKKYPESPEIPSGSTMLINNICAYPYPIGSKKPMALYKSNVNDGALNDNHSDGGNNYVIGDSF